MKNTDITALVNALEKALKPHIEVFAREHIDAVLTRVIGTPDQLRAEARIAIQQEVAHAIRGGLTVRIQMKGEYEQ